MIKVSVIIPVYNTEKYLEECLESVINQTLKEIEIICIDDGSTDRSVEILKRFQEKDPRIQILFQNNSYAGVARNTGKAAAQGEYLVFWDSDDFFYNTALEKMYNKSREDQADVCICDGYKYLDNEKKTIHSSYLIESRIPKTIPFNFHTAPDHLLDMVNPAPWNKMFLRAFVENNELNFMESRNANDVFFVLSAMCLAEAITVVKEPLVCYRENRTSGLSETRVLHAEDYINAYKNILYFLKKKNRFPEQSYSNRALSSMIYILEASVVTWDSYRSLFERLQNGVLQELGLLGRESGFFYNAWEENCLYHMKNDTAESFLVFLFSDTDRRLKNSVNRQTELRYELNAMKKMNRDLTKSNNNLRQEKEKIKKSYSYRAGRFITWIPRKIKVLLYRIRKGSK